MPTKKPRISIVLENPLYKSVEHLAKRDGVSLSLKVRDLVKEGLEVEEDMMLGSFAEKREENFDPKTALDHDLTWSS